MSTTARLEARLPVEAHAMLKRAAEIEGRTLTDFVVAAAQADLPALVRITSPCGVWMRPHSTSR